MKTRLPGFYQKSKNPVIYWRSLTFMLLLLNFCFPTLLAQEKSWDKTLGTGSDDQFQALRQTSDGNYILSDFTNAGKSGNKTEDSRGRYDHWMVKQNENGKKKQIIAFNPILSKSYGDAPFTLSAKVNSGLPIRFSIVAGPAVIKDNIVTLTGIGTVTIKASQEGNEVYSPAADVFQTFLVENATTVTKVWDKTLGGRNRDNLKEMVATPDGGYLLGGSSLNDYSVVKTDANGSEIWEKTFGSESIEELTRLIVTPDGGFLLGGESIAGINGDKTEASKGKIDYWVVKIDSRGHKVWDKTLGGDQNDRLTSLVATPDGGYLVGGSSNSGKGGDKSENNKETPNEYGYFGDYWVVKLDANGQKIWDKTLGGANLENLRAIEITSDGGYLLGGFSHSGKSGDKSESNKGTLDEAGQYSSDYWVIKLDAKGQKVWDKTLGGNNPDRLTALAATLDGGYLLGGTSESKISGDKKEANRGSVDYWLVKIDSKGTKIWDKTLGGNKEDNLKAIKNTPDGNYLLGGSSGSDISGDKSQANRESGCVTNCFASTDFWVIKINIYGAKIWDKTIGGIHQDVLNTIVITSDGSYLLGGSSNSSIGGDKSEANRGSEDYWVVKLEEELPFKKQWDKRYGGSGNDYFTSVIRTSDGGYLSGGYTNSGVSGDKSQSSQGKNDYWIVKSDKNGKKLWDKRYGGTADDFLNRVIQTKDGGYLLGGSSLSGKSGDKTEASRGDRDYWVVKVDKQGNKEWDKTFGGSGSDDFRKVIQLPSGEYVLGGSSNSPLSGNKSQPSQGGSDYWLVKISRTGEKLWDKRYGGSLYEKLGSFTDTQGDGFLLAGSSFSGISGDKSQVSQGNNDYWVVQIDKDGNLLWEKTFGGKGVEEVYSLGRSNGANLFIAGTSTSGKEGDKSQGSQGGKDYWLLKLDASGTKLWDKTLGGSAHDELRFSEFSTVGHYILAGYSYSGISGDKTQASQGASDYWVVEVDERGEKIADQRFGGSGEEELRTVFQTKDGGLLLGGRSDSGVSGDRTQPSQGGMDYWLVKVATGATSIIAEKEAALVAEPIIKTEPSPLTVYPNPARELVIVSFTVPQTQAVSVRVYDNQGQEITTLFQGEAKANQTYQLEWQAGSKAAGLYILQLQTATKQNQQKVFLTK